MEKPSQLLPRQRTPCLSSRPVLNETSPCLGKMGLLAHQLPWAVKAQAPMAPEMTLAPTLFPIGQRTIFPRGQMFLSQVTSPLNVIRRTEDMTVATGGTAEIATGCVIAEIRESHGRVVTLGRAKTIVTRGIPVSPGLWRWIDLIALATTWTAVETTWRLATLARRTCRLARDNRNESGCQETPGQTDPRTG